MSLLTGMTEAGQEVPVQVKPDGRLVAEGLTGPTGPAGPVGPAGAEYWKSNAKGVYLDSGNLGLGTAAPWSLASVAGSGTAGDVTSARQISAGPSSAYNVSLGYYQTGPSQPFAGVIQALDGGNGDRLLLNPSGGSVGIGTTLVAARLDVVETYATSALLVRHSGTAGGGAAINVANGRTSTTPIYGFYYNGTTGIGNPEDNVVSTIIGGSEALRVDSSRRLLVGTITGSGDSLLQVNGKASAHSLKLRSPDGSWWDVGVSDAGALTATRAALLKK